MTVCKFFLEGRCNFGSSCRNEHPERNNHRFGATDSNNPLRGRIGFPGSSTDYNSSSSKIFDDRSVRADLSKDRPEYKYSSYGPAKEEPNLLEGTDFSPEELRVQYYSIMSTTNGVDTAYHAGVKDLEDRMQGQIDAILRDVRSALSRFDAKRQQLAQQATSGFSFGQQQPPQPQPEHQPQQQGAYGTPSVLGAPAPSVTPSAFGSSINQPNTPSLMGSSYNQPTNQPTAATPSLFGSTPSAFGSSFGGTSSLGYPGAQAQPVFGGGFQPQPQQPDPQQQQYLLQMQQQQELMAQQQQQQQMLMLQQQQMQQQQQQSQPGNTQGTINNPQMQAFASSEFQLYQIPEIPPPSEFRR